MKAKDLIERGGLLFGERKAATTLWQEIADQLQGPGFYVDFLSDVKPILESKCLACHHSDSEVTPLSFESFADVRAANRKHHLIIPGEPERSGLFLVTVLPDHFAQAMPHGASAEHRLDKGDYMILHHWIAQGADWPLGEEGTLRPPSSPDQPPRKKHPAPLPPDVV